MKMDEYRKANQVLWNTWTPHNVTSKFYDIDGFKTGKNTLDAAERAGFDDVQGKSLLHLQCHFGMDTLSWARLGANVTGIDFSHEAIRAARQLADDIGMNATFIQSDLYELPKNLTGQFDYIFTSHGVLGWLSDLNTWGQIAAHFLKPGASFYVVEAHPFLMMFDGVREGQPLVPTLPYFHQEKPMEFTETGWYAQPESTITTTSFEWNHSVADIIGAVTGAGLELIAFEEYTSMAWPHFPWMVQEPNGSWVMPKDVPQLPLQFSLKAKRPR